MTRKLIVVFAIALLVCSLGAAQTSQQIRIGPMSIKVASDPWPVTWPAEVKELRVPLADAEVKSDPVWGSMAARWGYPTSIFQRVTGAAGVLIPEHSHIEMTWGTNPRSITDAKLVYPALQKALENGVLYDIGNGWAFHAERGKNAIGTNHILALVELPQVGLEGPPGNDGNDGQDGARGPAGPPGPAGKNACPPPCPPQRHIPPSAQQSVCDTGGIAFPGRESKDSRQIGSVSYVDLPSRPAPTCRPPGPPPPPPPPPPPGGITCPPDVPRPPEPPPGNTTPPDTTPPLGDGDGWGGDHQPPDQPTPGGIEGQPWEPPPTPAS